MIEKEIEIESKGSNLSGTICIPEDKGSFPFVLMVHGSGPLDRDENMANQKLNIFNSIAYHLASVGIASLRYDKRGCGKSSGSFYKASHFDFVEDAIACFDTLDKSELCMKNNIYVLGHSEGCIIAPQMSLKRPSIAGIVLLCPFVQNMESILINQARHIQEAINNLEGIKGIITRLLLKLMGDPVTSQRKLIDKLKSSSTPTIRIWFRKIPANWLRELLQIDPQDILKRVMCPILMIGAEKDIQCDPADVRRIAELKEGTAEAHVIKGLTHILRVDEREPSIFHYAELIEKPVEPVVLKLVTQWLEQKICAQS